MITDHNFSLSALRLGLATGTLVLTALLCNVAYGQPFFQWTDEDGTTHFSDKPPQGVEAKMIGKKRRNWRTQTEEDDSAPEGTDEGEADDQAQSDTPLAQKDPERCKIERDRLRVLQENTRIRMQSEDGSTRLLSPEEVQNEIEMTRKAVDYFCE